MDLDAGLGIASAAGARAELEQAIADLHGVIVGDRATVLEAADLLQGRGGGRWPPRRRGIRRAMREAGIVAREKSGQHALGVGERADLVEAEYRDQAILESPKEAFDASLGLGRMGADPANAEFRQRPANLSGVALATELLRERERRAGRDAEDAVAIGVDGAGEAIAAKELAQEEEVPVRILLEPEDGPEHAPGSVVDRGQEDEARAAVFKPRVVATVQLDEQPSLGHPLAPAAMARWTPGVGAADAGGAEEPLHRPTRQMQALALDEHLRQVMIVEASISRAGEGEDPGSDRLGEAAGRGPATVTMGESREAPLA